MAAVTLAFAGCNLGNDRSDKGPSKEELEETFERQNEYYRNLDSDSKKQIVSELDSMEALIHSSDKDQYIDKNETDSDEAQ